MATSPSTENRPQISVRLLAVKQKESLQFLQADKKEIKNMCFEGTTIKSRLRLRSIILGRLTKRRPAKSRPD